MLAKLHPGVIYIYVYKALLGNWVSKWEKFVDPIYALIKEIEFVMCYMSIFKSIILRRLTRSLTSERMEIIRKPLSCLSIF